MTELDPNTLLPLTPRAFHVLLALADQDCHRDAIIDSVIARTGGIIGMTPITTQNTLSRLMAAELIEETEARPVPGMEAEHPYYHLTPFGHRVLEAETTRLARLARQIESLREHLAHQ